MSTFHSESVRSLRTNSDENPTVNEKPAKKPKITTPPSVYPVSVSRHAGLASTDPMSRSSFQPYVSFNIAYAIYSFNLVSGSSVKAALNFDEKALYNSILKFGKQYQNSESYIKGLISKEYPLNELAQEFNSMAKIAGYESTPLTVKKAYQLDAQLNACSLDLDKATCCEMLFAPWSLGNGKYIPDDSNKRLSLANTKAWLGICSVEIKKTPKTLEKFKSIFGDYKEDLGWTVEFHPMSLAKRAGRRIYRRNSPTNAGISVAIAENLKEDCSVEETEVIYGVPDKEAIFVTYNHNGDYTPFGIFPGARESRTVKLTPDSCMGCHYKFDTREFDVFAPSFTALNLIFGGNARNDISCRTSKDTIIWHDAK